MIVVKCKIRIIGIRRFADIISTTVKQNGEVEIHLECARCA